MKRLLSLFLAAILLCGCSETGEPVEYSSQPQVVLRYYTIGRVDQDLKQVNEALNKLLMKRYGFGVDYRKLDFNEYETIVNGIINTNGDFDVMFSWDNHYARNAAQGVFLDLTPYLKNRGFSLNNAVDEKLWQGVMIHNKIFGVPTNKELAPVPQFLFSREMVEKYHISTDGVDSLLKLEPLLEKIHREEPEAAALVFTSERLNLAQMIGYEYVAGSSLPFVVKQGDPDCSVCNLYETEEMIELMKTLRRFYEKGYINEDAVLRTGISRFEGEQVFCRIGMGGPDAASSFSVDFGYPIVTASAGTPWVTNASARGGIMAINANTPYKEEALTFLTAVNLDPDVRNLLNYGIEGQHYSLTPKDQVHVLSDGYRGVPYTQGNWFLLKTMEGESPNKWETYRKYNSQAKSSCLLGFEPDLHALEQSKLRVSQTYLRYDNALLTGSVDPENYRIKALRQMELCGSAALKKVLQTQVNLWLSSGEAS